MLNAEYSPSAPNRAHNSLFSSTAPTSYNCEKEDALKMQLCSDIQVRADFFQEFTFKHYPRKIELKRSVIVSISLDYYGNLLTTTVTPVSFALCSYAMTVQKYSSSWYPSHVSSMFDPDDKVDSVEEYMSKWQVSKAKA
ncbi:unnamed protein product [Toxocara canis]|uniref:Cyclin_C domain-containing protein n=1 Tax=Toxocara canis TaxID=6265 RepID=A0A183UVL6_TOXCA|nr:unnamed protein product [Toxocara canis]